MSSFDSSLYSQLSAYTLAHPDPSFIHQNIVDAYTAQNADESTKPIAISFALIGLYLFLEKKFTGRQVQLAHIKMARVKKIWPKLSLPTSRGIVSVKEVLAVPGGKERDQMIRQWCASVWESYRDVQPQVRDLAKKELGIEL